MKKTAFLLLPLFFVSVGYAQVPQALNYQAIARNSGGQIIPSQSIGVRFSITDVTGTTILYQETHSAVTNAFGLFTLAIGRGTAVSGTIPQIDWGAGGDKYLKVEIAPQGGTNYTMQGSTQLLSVPYALYAEKTRLIGGTAITITNGNTISANYQAGPGIAIVGNTISATAANSWLLNGNSGTTAVNFLGTTDNQSLYLRTNNTNRIMIDAGQPVTGGSLSTAFFSDFASIRSAPAQLAVYGKDINGVAVPMHLFSSVEGMNWTATGGPNNTLGRFFRLTQMNNPTYSTGQFFDFGIDQGVSLYISNRGLNSVGGVLPKKMFTISPQDYVGINFNWGENPTANFHTKGTLRFEGVNSNNTLTRVLVMDNNGNVSSRDANTLGGSGSYWSLTGNAGTTNANFLGTTDNQSIFVRTNNTNRLMIDAGQTITGGNLSTAFLSDFNSIKSAPAQLAIYGKDVIGVSVPIHAFSSVEGMNWTAAGGTNNTLGRFLRFTQMNSPTYSTGQFYDFGIDQGVSFFISNRGLNSTGGILPKKMITINPQDFVGINFDWGQNPKSTLHVHDGDIYIDKIGSGVIMKSPDGQCWRMTVSNAGAPVFTAITCP